MDRARSFLASVAAFAGTVGSVHEFVVPEGEGSNSLDPATSAPEAAGTPPGEAAAGGFEEVVVYTDGASIGNPGPSGAGGVLLTTDGVIIEEFRQHIGHSTNNAAEYEAVRIGILKAIAHGARRVTVRMDSELVANQLMGRYKVKDRKLLEAYLSVEQLMSTLDDVRFETIPRDENSRADRLAQTGARMGR